MNRGNAIIRWAGKVPQWKIRRLYETDARGIIDTDSIDEVGWALWDRCDSILAVTAAHYGHVRCPECGSEIERQQPPPADECVICGACNWQIAWKTYHQSYRGKQLFGANAVDVFKAYHQAFPQAATPSAKMLLIDQLIHAFHVALTEIGRPAAANLIEGSLREVIQFLDALTHNGASAAGLGDSQAAWRHTLTAVPWSQQFIANDTDATPMNLSLIVENDLKFVEGEPDAAFLASIRDIDRLIAACFAEQANAALLYAANLTPAFFDLSSGEAGEILQKLRNYRIRLAVVYTPGSVVFSSRFGEMLLDEQGGPHFGVFESRQAAIEWLGQH